MENNFVDTTYAGFYARFDTASKKDAAILLGADNLVGDSFEVVFKTHEGLTIAWLKNRFDTLVGFLDTENTQRLRILHARDWKIRAFLSFVAYTDSPEPGHYWGEMAILCFTPAYEETFERFSKNIALRLIDGVRPEIDLGESAVEQIISTIGDWKPVKTVPMPTKTTGTAVMKSRRKVSEKLIEQGRKGNKGCYLASWIFLLVLIVVLVFGLKTCGVF